MAIVVNGAFPYFAGIFAGTKTDLATKIGLGSGTGAESAENTALSSAYTSGGFEQSVSHITYGTNSFTTSITLQNTSTSSRTVTEAGLFAADGTLLVRHLFSSSELLNSGVVPPGERITISFTVSFAGYTGGVFPSVDWITVTPSTQQITINAAVSVTTSASGTIDPTGFLSTGTDTILTDAAFPYFASVLCGNSTVRITKIGLGSGSTAETGSLTALASAYTDHGFEQTDCNIEYLNTTAHPHTLHASLTLTNEATVERQVTEAGLFLSNGVMIARHLFAWDEMLNFGYVPPGESIDIDFYIAFTEGYADVAWTAGNILTQDVSVLCSCECVGKIDPVNFTHRYTIEFNGYELPNCGIKTISGKTNEREWSLICYTQDISVINLLNRYAAPITSGYSVSGNKYVLSPMREGVLSIKTNGTYTHYENCYISGPINAEVFGLGYWFSFTIYQSSYLNEV